ncbi:hypothetical protein IEO21_09288 [Rhodonia placenta]|uniref:Uncharacterized protein n=1 Tax=Rhodonia placenta TaxID=104341 RepID=A0A8H7NUP9_9APHY|nr:hypothetical protein IEO21_09288 [Postia placenta]
MTALARPPGSPLPSQSIHFGKVGQKLAAGVGSGAETATGRRFRDGLLSRRLLSSPRLPTMVGNRRCMHPAQKAFVVYMFRSMADDQKLLVSRHRRVQRSSLSAIA